MVVSINDSVCPVVNIIPMARGQPDLSKYHISLSISREARLQTRSLAPSPMPFTLHCMRQGQSLFLMTARSQIHGVDCLRLIPDELSVQ